MRNLEEKIDGITILTKEEQKKVIGGMKWTGAGSKNIEMDQWTALSSGQPWGTINGYTVVH